MPSKIQPRAFTALTRSARQRPSCLRVSICSSAPTERRHGFNSSTSRPLEKESEVAERPRWKYTPPGMKAPISLRSDPAKRTFKVNSDPEVLDNYYIRMLGNGGDKMLSEEVKWQAITHKSFDQGRRGFNDRLAFLGKWVVQLQTSLSLVQDTPNHPVNLPEDPFGREPFQHPALEGLEDLTHEARSPVINKEQLAELGQKYGLQNVMRWSPKNPSNLPGSGIDLVLAHTMYAIIGAVAMEQGGLVANEVARKRILSPMGLRTTIS